MTSQSAGRCAMRAGAARVAEDDQESCRDSDHARANVLGVRVSAINLQMAVEMAGRWIDARRCGYMCLTGVHGVMEAQRDRDLRRILNQAFITAPDGMPMTWVGRHQGFARMDRVFGPDFMAAMCGLSAGRGYRNFLYGGKPGVADLLADALLERFPGLQIVGAATPPFAELTHEQEEEVFSEIRASRADIVWVGLSTPKQEQFMARYFERIQAPLLVGVGAAFDYHTGNIRDCSDWIKRAGLQWLHRLLQDPKRLWRRYLRNNPAFMWYAACQICGWREYREDGEPAISHDNGMTAK